MDEMTEDTEHWCAPYPTTPKQHGFVAWQRNCKSSIGAVEADAGIGWQVVIWCTAQMMSPVAKVFQDDNDVLVFRGRGH